MRNTGLIINHLSRRNLSGSKCNQTVATGLTSNKSTPSLSLDQSLPFESIPGPKPLPIVGNIWRYFPFVGDYKPDTLFENALYNKKKYGPIVREQLTTKHTILHLFDPNDIESFFRQDGKEPFRRSHRALLKYRRGCPEHYKDGGLFPENGSKWSRLRSIFQQHLLNRTKIAQRAPILDYGVMKFIANLKEHNDAAQQVHDNNHIRINNFERLLQKWSLTCSLAILLDYSFDSMPSDKTLDDLNYYLCQELEAIDWTEVKSERWANKPSKCPFYQRLAKSEKFLYQFVANRIDYLLETPQEMRNDSFIRDWLQEDNLHRHDVISFILDSMMASFHTMIFTTTFMLKNISECQEKTKLALLDEVYKNLPPIADGPVQSDMSENMPFLRDCLRETLRLNPVSIGTGRLTQHEEMYIRGYKVPKDVMIIAQTQAICRDEEIFDKADEFVPERWAEYRSMPRVDRPSAFAWLPFGFGPRACIGRRLANLQICILVGRLLQNYSEIEFKRELKTKTTLIHNIDGHVEIELKR